MPGLQKFPALSLGRSASEERASSHHLSFSMVCFLFDAGIVGATAQHATLVLWVLLLPGTAWLAAPDLITQPLACVARLHANSARSTIKYRITVSRKRKWQFQYQQGAPTSSILLLAAVAGGLLC
jgi:hypothetical protein